MICSFGIQITELLTEGESSPSLASCPFQPRHQETNLVTWTAQLTSGFWDSNLQKEWGRYSEGDDASWVHTLRGCPAKGEGGPSEGSGLSVEVTQADEGPLLPLRNQKADSGGSIFSISKSLMPGQPQNPIKSTKATYDQMMASLLTCLLATTKCFDLPMSISFSVFEIQASETKL